MALNRETAGSTTLIDVLDRILDKGMVIDAWIRVSLGGLDLLMVEARIVIASIETYLDRADALAESIAVAAPPATTPTQQVNSDKHSDIPARTRARAASGGSLHG